MTYYHLKTFYACEAASPEQAAEQFTASMHDAPQAIDVQSVETGKGQIIIVSDAGTRRVQEYVLAADELQHLLDLERQSK